MSKRKYLFILILLILAIVAINYPWMNSYMIKPSYEKETGIVERVIDGDTVVIESKSIRLLGINTPEKGEKYYDEAKEFLENLVLNKNVGLEKGKDDLDKYGRKLRYVFLNEKNIDLIMVENGFANPYFPSGKDKYIDKFYDVWVKCMTEDKNLCEKSQDKCAECILLKNISIKNQEITLYNKCIFKCNLTNWIVREEGRKKVQINNSVESHKEITIKTPEFWTKTGDSLFLRDGGGKLVLYLSY